MKKAWRWSPGPWPQRPRVPLSSIQHKDTGEAVPLAPMTRRPCLQTTTTSSSLLAPPQHLLQALNPPKTPDLTWAPGLAAAFGV